ADACAPVRRPCLPRRQTGAPSSRPPAHVPGSGGATAPACGGCRAVATTVTDVDLTALTVGLAAAGGGLVGGLLSPVITDRYMWKMDHEQWVRDRRADAYVRLTTQVLQYTQTVAGLPDDVPDIGEYLRARSPYKDPYGQETGQLIIAFGTPDMVRLHLSF